MILDELWYGNVLPHEQYTQGDTVLLYMQKKAVQSRNALYGTLTDQQKTYLQPYEKHLTAGENRRARLAYGYGLRLGSQLLLSILNDDI